MILKILLKSVLFISYCLLIDGIQTNFDWDSKVAAQDSIRQERKKFNLSQQEKANLQQGKVILKGEKGDYWAQVVTEGDLETAWLVLTDYNNFNKFLPNVAASKIVSEESNKVIFEQVNVVDLWLFQQEFKVQIEGIKTKPNKIDFQILEGDLKKLVGKWQLEEISPGKILVSHAVEVEPGSDTEKPFFYGVYESSLEDTLKAIAVEINKRSKN